MMSESIAAKLLDWMTLSVPRTFVPLTTNNSLISRKMASAVTTFRVLKASCLSAVLLILLASNPERAAGQELENIRSRVNDHNVTIMCGRQRGSFISWCDDLISFYNDRLGRSRRLLAVMGEGSQRNVEDLLFLRGVDLALAHASVIAFMESNGIHPNLSRVIRYVATLPGSDLHLLARKEIRTIDDLAGKVVNFSTPGTGSFLNNTDVFDRLGITVEARSDDERTALEKLRGNEIAAMGFSAARPWKIMAELNPNEGFHLLEIPFDRLGDAPYKQVEITASDYPDVVPDGDTISTISIPTLMLAYNWPEDHARCANVGRFVDYFRSNFSDLRSRPYDPKWQSVDPEFKIEGLERWEKRCSGAS